MPLKAFLNEAVIPYEADEVTRLIVDDHDAAAFAEISHLTVGEFRNWLLSPAADGAALERIVPGLTPEMVAAVSKLMRNRTRSRRRGSAAWSRAFAIRSGYRAGCRGCSRTTRPTT